MVFLGDDRRVPVHWSGFSQVKAALNLLRAATAHAVADRYVLLTGSDYPIRPPSDVHTALASDTEFTRIDRRVEGDPHEFPLENVSRYHILDSALFNPYAQPSEWRERIAEMVERIAARVPRPVPAGIPLYHGTGNWALTDACARHIVRFIAEDDAWLRRFRHTRSPDEIVFNSIVKASPFAPRISHDFEHGPLDDVQERGAHYVDWSDDAQARGHVLDMRDLPALRASPALFARKFDEVVSAELLDALDELRAG